MSAARTGFHGNINHRNRGEAPANVGVKFFKTFEYCFSCYVFIGGQIIFAAVYNHLLGLIVENHFIFEAQHVEELRASEGAVDNRVFGKILRQTFPKSERRTPDKQNFVFSGKMNAVRLFEGLNVGRKRNLRFGGKRQKKKK